MKCFNNEPPSETFSKANLYVEMYMKNLAAVLSDCKIMLAGGNSYYEQMLDVVESVTDRAYDRLISNLPMEGDY